MCFCSALLWYFQEKLLFHPGEPPGFKTPDKNPAGLKHPGESGEFQLTVFRPEHRFACFLIGMEYEDVTITTDDNMHLHAYGWSTGSPSEPGLYKDAEAALFYLMGRSDIDQSKIFLFGRSVGGAVAIDLAARRFPVLRGVVVENTFTNLHEIVDLLFPVFRPFRPLIRFIQRLSMDNKSKVATIEIPFLFISGLQDTLVPPEHMRTLYEASSSKYKRLYKVQNGTHNETWHQGGAEYYEVMLDFIEKASAIPPHHYQSSTAETETCFQNELSMELEKRCLKNASEISSQPTEKACTETADDIKKIQ